MKAVCRYCAGGVGGGVARGSAASHQRAKCQDHRSGKKQGSKLKGIIQQEVGGTARGGETRAVLYGGSHDGGDGGAIRTDIEKDDLRLAAECACLLHVVNWSRMVSQLTYCNVH